MLYDYDRILRKNAFLYIQEMKNASECISDLMRSQPLIEYLLSASLLKLTGFIEQKLDTLKILLGNKDADFRYGLLRNSSKLSSDYDVVDTIYSKFKNIIEEMEIKVSATKKNFGTTLFDNREQLEEAFQAIKLLFSDSIICNQSIRSFLDFLSFENKILTYTDYIHIQNAQLKICPNTAKKDIQKKLNHFRMKNKELIEYQKNHNNQFPKDCPFLATGVLKKIYMQTIQYRHTIAHNLNSVQFDSVTLLQLKSNEIIYENYFIRFMIILTVDNIFRKMYIYYHSLEAKYLL